MGLPFLDLKFGSGSRASRFLPYMINLAPIRTTLVATKAVRGDQISLLM